MRTEMTFMSELADGKQGEEGLDEWITKLVVTQ